MMREGHAREDDNEENHDESTPYFDKKITKKGMKDNGNSKVTGHRKNSTSQGNK